MLTRILALLGSLRVTVAGLILLLILTVWGTLFQVEHGLYGAQARFYQSWSFLIAGVIPFPGAQTVMCMLFVNLAASVLRLALQRRLRFGFLATHLGLAMMLAAGAVTFYFGRSARLTLAEGESANVAVSSQEWEVALLPAAPESSRLVWAIDARRFEPVGRKLALADLQITLIATEFHRNCARTGAPPPPARSGDTGEFRTLPPAREPQENLPGLGLTVVRPGRPDEPLSLWGGDLAPAVIETETGRMEVVLRRLRMPLPATIELADFRRELHPGSSMARSFSSLVNVRSSAGADRKVLISMNKPLRVKGFTFYQSSFSSGPGGRETSTLAVVENFGRLMPYVATGLTGAGMAFHFGGLLLGRLRKAPNRSEP